MTTTLTKPSLLRLRSERNFEEAALREKITQAIDSSDLSTSITRCVCCTCRQDDLNLLLRTRLPEVPRFVRLCHAVAQDEADEMGKPHPRAHILAMMKRAALEANGDE